ncbi:putative F-box protein At5g38390 [Nicotiana tomentosiformis]|uniref:putative F-box protein At5g38390 n=1 Tax=Nicotiana tomentosiformis TaxID=4098 RepID=UPI00388C9AF4
MDGAHPLSTPMVVRSLDMKKDSFRPQEKNEELLGPECQKGVCTADGGISQLPDEILVYILSFLAVKEAAETSVLSRRWEVERLELDLLKGGEDIRDFDYCYTFPERLLGLSGSSSGLPHSNNFQTFPLLSQNFKSVKVLLLKSVNVTGEVLEFFLHNCPFLEQMVVHGSGTLVNLEVVGPFLKLRHLEIWYCFNVESLKICDTNLITLGTSSGKKLLLKNVPMLR